MAKGLPKSIIRQYGISKRAWQEYRKRKTPTKKVIRVKRSKPTRGKRKVARRRRRRKRRTKTIPLLPVAGFIASTNAFDAWSNIQRGQYMSALTSMISGWTGYSIRFKNFEAQRLTQGLLPIVAGIVGHKVMSMLGVNRYFANLPSPLNKLRL